FVAEGSASSATLSVLAREVVGTNSADKIAAPLDAAAARRNSRCELMGAATSVFFSVSFRGMSQFSLSIVTLASHCGVSGRVHKYDFSGFDRRDDDSGFIRNRDAVTLSDLLVIHHDSSARGNEIAVSGRGQGICNALPRFDRGAEYPGVGLNPQRILVFRKSAREWHQPTRALHTGKRFSSPGGIESKPTRQEPDLKDSQARVGVVVFGVPNTTAGGDRLHVSRTNLAPTTRTVFVFEYAFVHIRDDLHVAM